MEKDQLVTPARFFLPVVPLVLLTSHGSRITRPLSRVAGYLRENSEGSVLHKEWLWWAPPEAVGGAVSGSLGFSSGP